MYVHVYQILKDLASENIYKREQTSDIEHIWS